MRILYASLGFIFLLVGIVGVVTPLLPTTPFLLLSAACFARGSERFHSWLMTHPSLSKPIHDWQKSGVIRLSAKILATFFIVLNLSFPVFFISAVTPLIKILVVIIGATVLSFIWSRPSTPQNNSRES